MTQEVCRELGADQAREALGNEGVIKSVIRIICMVSRSPVRVKITHESWPGCRVSLVSIRGVNLETSRAVPLDLGCLGEPCRAALGMPVSGALLRSFPSDDGPGRRLSRAPTLVFGQSSQGTPGRQQG